MQWGICAIINLASLLIGLFSAEQIQRGKKILKWESPKITSQTSFAVRHSLCKTMFFPPLNSFKTELEHRTILKQKSSLPNITGNNTDNDAVLYDTSYFLSPSLFMPYIATVNDNASVSTDEVVVNSSKRRTNETTSLWLAVALFISLIVAILNIVITLSVCCRFFIVGRQYRHRCRRNSNYHTLRSYATESTRQRPSISELKRLGNRNFKCTPTSGECSQLLSQSVAAIPREADSHDSGEDDYDDVDSEANSSDHSINEVEGVRRENLLIRWFRWPAKQRFVATPV